MIITWLQIGGVSKIYKSKCDMLISLQKLLKASQIFSIVVLLTSFFSTPALFLQVLAIVLRCAEQKVLGCNPSEFTSHMQSWQILPYSHNSSLYYKTTKFPYFLTYNYPIEY